MVPAALAGFWPVETGGVSDLGVSNNQGPEDLDSIDPSRKDPQVI